MSHLNDQPEDNRDIKAAKAIAQGNAEACDKELVRLLVACLDDRSGWIAKAAEAADSITDLSIVFQACSEEQQRIMSAAIGVDREIRTMLEPDDSAPEALKDFVVSPVIELMENRKS